MSERQLRLELMGLLRNNRDKVAYSILLGRGFTEEEAKRFIEKLKEEMKELPAPISAGKSRGVVAYAQRASLLNARVARRRRSLFVQFEPPSYGTGSSAPAVKRRYVSPMNIIFAVLLQMMGVDDVRQILYTLTFRLIKRGEAEKLRKLFMPRNKEIKTEPWYRMVIRELKDDIKWALAENGKLELYEELMGRLERVTPFVVEVMHASWD